MVGSGGSLQVEYSKGGVPRVFVQESQMNGTGLCGYSGTNTTSFTSATNGSMSTMLRGGGGRWLMSVVSGVALALSSLLLSL